MVRKGKILDREYRKKEKSFLRRLEKEKCQKCNSKKKIIDFKLSDAKWKKDSFVMYFRLYCKNCNNQWLIKSEIPERKSKCQEYMGNAWLKSYTQCDICGRDENDYPNLLISSSSVNMVSRVQYCSDCKKEYEKYFETCKYCYRTYSKDLFSVKRGYCIDCRKNYFLRFKKFISSLFKKRKIIEIDNWWEEHKKTRETDNPYRKVKIEPFHQNWRVSKGFDNMTIKIRYRLSNRIMRIFCPKKLKCVSLKKCEKCKSFKEYSYKWHDIECSHTFVRKHYYNPYRDRGIIIEG